MHSHRRDLPLLVAAVGISALGDWLALIPLALHVEDATGSGPAVAALFIATWGPAVALARPAGRCRRGRGASARARARRSKAS